MISFEFFVKGYFQTNDYINLIRYYLQEEPIMIVDITEQINLVDIIKGVLPSELERFLREYIKDHVFLTLKDISYNYINTYYRSPLLRIERNKVIMILNMKLGRVFTKLCNEGIIRKYNSKTYKRVE